MADRPTVRPYGRDEMLARCRWGDPGQFGRATGFVYCRVNMTNLFEKKRFNDIIKRRRRPGGINFISPALFRRTRPHDLWPRCDPVLPYFIFSIRFIRRDI